MIHIDWPWLILALPLPWLFARILPPVKAQGDALFLPFAAQIAVDDVPTAKRHSRQRRMLFAVLWCLLIAAAVRPQWLDEPLPVPTTGRHMLLAVDVSGSMAEQDMAGNASRLDVVQAVAGEFISRRHGDQIGLILFGTRPYLQTSLTADLATVDHFLQQSVVGIAGTQTAIGDAIGLAVKRLQDVSEKAGEVENIGSVGRRKPAEKVLTDGANNSGMADPIAAAKIAASVGLRIYTIGVGALPQQGFFSDSGNSDLDEATLKSIAEITHGEYFRATDADALSRVYARIDQIEPSAGRDQWYRPHTEWFPWPLGLALLLSVPAVFLGRKD